MSNLVKGLENNKEPKNNNEVLELCPTLLNYKSYGNGNLHLRINKEFMKALNIEASRLFGWVKDSDDILNEFDCNITKEDVDKYFGCNNTAVDLDNIDSLLTIKK
jgi:regulator of sigma D